MQSNEKAHEHKVTQRYAVQEWKNSFEEQRRANNGWKRLNAAHGTRQVSGPPNESSSSQTSRSVSSSSESRSDATARSDAASVSNVVPWGVAQNAGNAARGAAPDAAQDTAMSGGADRRRTIPRETENDEERSK